MKNNKNKATIEFFDETPNLINRNFDEIIAEGFNRYAKYIIQDRALPELKDGLKPVQRRILYAMYKLNLFPNSQFKKSARTVGDVLGKYHPHGDSSIYEALIRMAQDWKNNIPLIEVHGNKGSIDDDPAAAMRYTEARLSNYGNEMLSNIDKKIYPFINNFDDTETEPTILSSLLPNLLINGASGIAAGYATSIPTFNISELLNAIIMVIKHKKSSVEDILKIMPGPDFPTGGMIINYDEVKKCYLTGEAKITIRSNYYLQKAQKKENDKIIITDIPYETIKSEIIKQIEDLRVNNKLPGVLSVIDATDKNGICIELELSNNQVNVIQIMNFLYKKTQLQVNFSANMIVINERKPIKIGVLDYIHFYITYAINTIIKVEQYLLNEDENRYEVVLGLIKALSILDEVIAIIRKSNDKADSIKNLVEKFQFSNKQAEAIVSLRLYRLSNTDVTLLNKEKDELELKISNHKKIINNEDEQEAYLILQLKSYIKQFGYERKTKINKDENLVISNTNEKDLLTSKEVKVIITNNHQTKYLTRLESDLTKFNNINYKSDNDYLKFILNSNIKSSLIIFTSLARVVSIDVFKLQEAKWKDNGEDLTNKLHLLADEKIVQCFDTFSLKNSSAKYLLFATKSGKMKRVDKQEFISDKEMRLSSCMNLEENDVLIDVVYNYDISDQILSFTKKGNVLKFDSILIPLVSMKAKGVNAMKLQKDDSLMKVISYKEDENAYLNIFSNQFYKALNINDIKQTNRNLVGTNLLNTKKKQKLLNVFIANKDLIYYGYDEKNNFVDLSNLAINNTNNWASLNDDLIYVNAYIKQE